MNKTDIIHSSSLKELLTKNFKLHLTKANKKYNLRYDEKRRCFKLVGDSKFKRKIPIDSISKFQDLLKAGDCYNLHTSSTGLLLDTRAIQRLLISGEITINPQPNDLKSKITELAKLELEEQNKIKKDLINYLKKQSQDQPQIIASKIIADNRLFYDKEDKLTLIDPDTKRIRFQSTEINNNDSLLSYLTSPHLNNDIFLSRMGSYKTPGKRLLPGLRLRTSQERYHRNRIDIYKGFGGKLQHFSEFTNIDQESDPNIILDGFDDLAAAITQSQAPDTSAHLGQALGIYPVFLYAVWIGVAGLYDEKEEKYQELYEATQVLAATKGDITRITELIKIGKIDRSSIETISKFLSSEHARDELTQKVYLHIRKKELECKSEDESEEKKQAWWDHKFALGGFSAMTLMFGAVASYDLRAFMNVGSGATGWSTGSKAPEFSMDTTGYSNSAQITSDYGALTAIGGILATVGQGLMTAYATYQAYQYAKEEKEKEGEIEGLAQDTGSFKTDDRLKNISLSILKLEKRYTRKQKWANSSLALGQLCMASGGPALAGCPPLLFAGVVFTLAGVATGVSAGNTEQTKLSKDGHKTGKLHEFVIKKFKQEIQKNLAELQKSNNVKRQEIKQESGKFQEIINTIALSPSQKEKITGVFDMLYLKISMSDYLIEKLKDQNNSETNVLEGELIKDLHDLVNKAIPENQQGAYIDQIHNLIDFVIETEQSIKKHSAGIIEKIEKTVNDRNHAMSVANQNYALVLITNQIIKRIPSYQALSRKSIDLAIAKTKQHYKKNKNIHQTELFHDLHHFEEDIKQILLQNFQKHDLIAKENTSIAGKKPKENYPSFLSAWYDITSTIEETIDRGDIVKKYLESSPHDKDRRLMVCRSVLKEATNKLTKNTRRSLIDEIFKDKELKFKTLKVIGTDHYRRGKGVNNDSSVLSSTGSITKIGVKTGALSGSGIRQGIRSKKVYKVDEEKVKTQFIKNTTPLLKVFDQELKKGYRSLFFNSALDYMQVNQEIEKVHPKEIVSSANIGDIPATEGQSGIDEKGAEKIKSSINRVNKNSIETESKLDEYIIGQLKSQSEKINPDQAYKGCGIKGTFSKFRGKDSIKINEVFSSEGDSRFKFLNHDRGLIAKDVPLEGCYITHIFIDDTYKAIDILTNKQIATAFHDQEGDTLFYLNDGKHQHEVSCAKENKKVFVTNSCDTETKEKLSKQGVSGSLYKVKEYGVKPIFHSESDLINLKMALYNSPNSTVAEASQATRVKKSEELEGKNP